MEKLIGMVQKILKDSEADNETLELWKSIAQWYEDGGPDAVEQGITKKVKEIKSITKKQLNKMKEVMPKKKKRKKTRR